MHLNNAILPPADDGCRFWASPTRFQQFIRNFHTVPTILGQ